ncbi:subclass B3 metallo-beta-lactamase [Pelagerythrobacter rhizovicinus]|uniref:Subclass B3 metallo-beta-lactamase n=1 Tax=Pelagerythrobacter rhizovicinus TaxID=2268576 RepID=A0A4V1QWE3_9SPHN|nr:subclass B3 metallo-beta-lactamase [Pelagerythrobacter rhizovicinus]RXZ65856.1 subclass B3 metallo-beta-lactamase [Pelagerythrobacter rhizovicinus]
MKRGMIVIGALIAASAPAHSESDPLLQPIAPEKAREWLTPQDPVRVFGNTYLVGFGGLNIVLIRTDDGLVLLDGGLPQGVPQVEANIRRLGLELSDVKLILSTEPHYDHSGGLAALARDTGAPVLAGERAAATLRRGRSGPDDPQVAWLPPFPPVEQVRIVGDREQIRLGDVTITALATPGHTPGSMSWTWRSCESGRCADVVFAASLNPLAAEGYRFSAPANRAETARFRQTFDKLRSLSCDILLTTHPAASQGDVKLARLQQEREPNPFLDPQACADYADTYERALVKRLAEEAGAGGP